MRHMPGIQRFAPAVRIGALLCLTLGLLPAAPLVQEARAGGATAGLRPDFNGDGFDDLAIGEPLGTVQGVEGAGRVVVLYGSKDGLRSSGAQVWSQASKGIPESPGEDDQFGVALAHADFDDDGFADLAIGVPGEDTPGTSGPDVDEGVVNIIYGSGSGLRANANLHEMHQGTQEGQRYGSALAAADVITPGVDSAESEQPDGHPDLAIGSPGFDGGCCPANISDSGAVHVLSSDEQGVSGSLSIVDVGPAEEARMGSSLAAGDFGAGPDIAMGAPGATVGGDPEAGLVDFLLDPGAISPDTTEIQGTAEPGDSWGSSLAAGDFDGDGHDDLAVGAPREDLTPSGGVDAGLVNVIYGSSGGLDAHNNEILLQQPDSLGGEDEPEDLLGFSLETADFGRGPQADLAIGVVGEDSDRGLVHVAFGSPGGLGIRSAETWTQGSPGVLSSRQPSDFFGVSLGAGRFGKGGRADLAIGAPGENLDGNENAGAVAILYSNRTGLTANGDQLWHPDRPGVPGAAADSVFFGAVLYSSVDVAEFD